MTSVEDECITVIAEQSVVALLWSIPTPSPNHENAGTKYARREPTNGAKIRLGETKACLGIISVDAAISSFMVVST